MADPLSDPSTGLSPPSAVGRIARAGDLPAVAACLTSAFHEDPVWGHWAFPDVSRRRDAMLHFMTLQAELALPRGWTAMTPDAAAVTIWTPPGATYGSAELQRHFDAALERLFGARASDLRDLFEQFEAHIPEGRFYHLEWWATDRRFAGQGRGAALLQDNLARVDAEHMPAYLESTNPANLPRYEALGFRRLGELVPRGGPTVTTMWREAR